MPISKKAQKKTFEQMLEEELAKENIAKGVDSSQHLLTIESSKKTFLKRNSTSVTKNQSTTKKQYKYYVDNFQNKKKDTQRSLNSSFNGGGGVGMGSGLVSNDVLANSGCFGGKKDSSMTEDSKFSTISEIKKARMRLS